MGLYDQVLIKDNHIFVVRRASCALRKDGKEATLKEMVETARKKNIKGTIVEIEVATPAEFEDALKGKPDIIMLDNMGVRDVKACVEIRRMSRIKALLEVSGGINLDTIEEYAKTGIDMISVGSLTHSVKSIDMSLEIV
jgi:nicotinate-nucleotide pyrophosphorylase (carboxylating)